MVFGRRFESLSAPKRPGGWDLVHVIKLLLLNLTTLTNTFAHRVNAYKRAEKLVHFRCWPIGPGTSNFERFSRHLGRWENRSRSIPDSEKQTGWLVVTDCWFQTWHRACEKYCVLYMMHNYKYTNNLGNKCRIPKITLPMTQKHNGENKHRF